MLDLFHFHLHFRQIHETERYPAELVDAFIERAINGTDSRLRALPGYSKQLRGPVLQALDHVMQLVNAIPAPVQTTVDNYRENPLLGALFASTERMFDVLAHDRELTRALKGPAGNRPRFALLLARVAERSVLGIDEQDGQVRRDVQQTVVSFDEHRLLDVQADEDETRHALKRRAYDFILARILALLESRRTARERLGNQRKLLLRKRELLHAAGWSFTVQSEPAQCEKLEQQLHEVESELATLGAPAKTLAIHLEMVTKGLEEAGRQLWLEQATLVMDQRHIVRTHGGSGAREIHYQRLCDCAGDRMAALLLEIDPAILPRVDFFKEKARYLA